MENLDQRFKVSKNIAQIMKNGMVYLTFENKDDDTVFELEGSVGEFLKHCDGSHTIKAIIDILKLTIETEEDKQSFSEMLAFLKQHNIIEKV